MDVTAMLNQTPTTTIKQSKAKFHSRNRTPWDAGGYSLPLTTESHSTSIHSSSPPAESAESIVEHKLSDSCGSLSSFTSSNSIPHSRYSSTSTVGSFHRFSQFTIEDNIQTELKKNSHTSKSEEASSSPASPLGLMSEISPRTKFLEAFTPTVEYLSPELSQDEAPRKIEAKNLDVIRSTSVFDRIVMSDVMHWERPVSPSDKMLIRRPLPPTQPSDLEFTESFLRHRPIESKTLSEAPDQHTKHHTGAHKRAASAPDVPGSGSNSPENEPKTRGPTVEPTPPSSDAHSPGTNSLTLAVPNTPLAEAPPDEATDEPPLQAPCLYMSNCTTDAPRRKAVSHIFGRNKMCTRSIPKPIWVYYCRKHYQRARYRNGPMWAKLQVDLVLEQIRRLEEWGAESKRTGTGGVVEDYTLAIRKREQKRLDEVGNSDKNKSDTKKSKSRDIDIESEDDSAEAQDNTCPATAVPKWLRDLSGGRYDGPRIKEVVEDIGKELRCGNLPLFPDIEILPSIIAVGDNNQPKDQAKRKTPRASHKRSHSLGTAIDPEDGLKITESAPWSSSSYARDGGLPAKRKRLSEADDLPGRQKMRSACDSAEFERHGQHLVRRRPVFPDMKDLESHDYKHSRRSQSCLQGPPPLAAPMRSESSAVAIFDPGLQNSNDRYSDQAQKIHKRSQSEAFSPYTARSFARPFAPSQPRSSVSGLRFCDMSLSSDSPSPVLQTRTGTQHQVNLRHIRNRSIQANYQGASPLCSDTFSKHSPSPTSLVSFPRSSSFYVSPQNSRPEPNRY